MRLSYRLSQLLGLAWIVLVLSACCPLVRQPTPVPPTPTPTRPAPTAVPTVPSTAVPAMLTPTRLAPTAVPTVPPTAVPATLTAVPKGSGPVVIQVTPQQMAVLKSLPADLVCLTSARNPIQSLEGLGDDEFASWVTSPTIPQKLMAAFGRKDTLTGLRIIGTGHADASFAKNPKLRLFITHESYANDIIAGGGVRIEFKEGLTPVPTGRAAAITVMGKISNLAEAKQYLADDTYLQLVRLSAEGLPTFSTDAKGRLAMTSDLPKIPVPEGGAFSFLVERLPSGTYVVAAQHLNAPAQQPLLVNSNNRIKTFEIPQDPKLPLTIDVGDLAIQLPKPT